jgi:mono/diheme cytochrome c family protein
MFAKTVGGSSRSDDDAIARRRHEQARRNVVMRLRQSVRWLAAAILLSGALAGAESCQKKSAQEPPAAPVTMTPDSAAALDPGQQTFITHCAACHGLWGAGDGPLAAQLEADLHTQPAALNDRERMSQLSHEDLVRIISQGGAHTGRSNLMPPWAGRLDRNTIGKVADFLKVLPDLSPGTPSATVQAFLAAPPGVPEEGRKTFLFYCAMCHGPEGRGDGALADTLWARNRIRPRNLTDSTYFAAKTDQQLFALVSLGGAHFHKSRFMPVWSVTLKPEQIKNLVSYIRALSHTKSSP